MLDPKSVEMIVNTIRDADVEKKGNPENEGTLKRLSEWIGLPNAIRAGRELMGIEKLRVIPPDRQYTFVFDSLTWEWNQSARSYFAEGQAYLLWMKDMPVNRQVHVKAKISFSRAGNTFDLYIEAAPELFFLFSYRPGTMQTMSSIDAYNTSIVALKMDERTVKAKGTVKQYMLIQAPDSRLRQVLYSFENKEGEIDEVEVEAEKKE
jgi:hypothetical protein